MNTYFVIEMLKNNILGFRQFKPSYAHSDNDIKKYETSVMKIFEQMSKIDFEKPTPFAPAHTGFSRLVKE